MANVENGALQSAIDNAAVGETVVLIENITLASRVTVSNVVTIDLNGYTIVGDINDGYGAIYVGTKGVLTIKDSSNKQTGGIVNTVGCYITIFGDSLGCIICICVISSKYETCFCWRCYVFN